MVIVLCRVQHKAFPVEISADGFIGEMLVLGSKKLVVNWFNSVFMQTK